MTPQKGEPRLIRGSEPLAPSKWGVRRPHKIVDFERHFSAGGVVYRIGDDGAEVVLCGRDAGGTWSLPKGTPEPGESVAQTALREVREETGLEVEIEGGLGDITYWFARPGVRVRKKVAFYLMASTGGSTDDHDPEFDRVQWFPADRAADVMTHPTERDVVRKGIAEIERRGSHAAAPPGV